MVKVSTSCSLKMVNVTEFKFCTLTPLYDIYMVVCYEEDWRLSWQKVIELTWLYPATNLCIRGSRVKWRRMEIEDGAGLPYVQE